MPISPSNVARPRDEDDELDLLGVAEDPGRNGTTKVDVEAFHLARLRVEVSEAARRVGRCPARC